MVDEHTPPQVDHLYLSMLLSLEASAMQLLGKIANPMTGKVERDLAQAKITIDMIEMLEKKTSGNLSSDEDNMTKRVLYQLRMNYVDEVSSDQKESTDSTESSDSKQSEDKPAESEEKPDISE